ncbi:hypothetical protein M758_UG193100 [Ceratodon purpureus]|nr:hypothetical protein M758_UG193100 [Ceratodon purpureus]
MFLFLWLVFLPSRLPLFTLSSKLSVFLMPAKLPSEVPSWTSIVLLISEFFSRLSWAMVWEFLFADLRRILVVLGFSLDHVCRGLGLLPLTFKLLNLILLLLRLMVQLLLRSSSVGIKAVCLLNCPNKGTLSFTEYTLICLYLSLQI